MKLYFHRKNWKLFILISLSLKKMFIVFFSKTSWSGVKFKLRHAFLKQKISVLNNGIALSRKLRYSITRELWIYEAFLRPHLDYCDVIYDKTRNEKFLDTLESIQYNATLAITGAIKGTSKENWTMNSA